MAKKERGTKFITFFQTNLRNGNILGRGSQIRKKAGENIEKKRKRGKGGTLGKGEEGY